MTRLNLILAAVALALMSAAPLRAEMVWLRGAAGDPGSLDPHKAQTQIESNVLSELFEGLLTRNARGELVAGVAESWSATDDGLVYAFKFRPGVRWSNGDRVTPNDFVYAFRRLMSPATGAPYANILYTLKNAARVNKGELPLEALGARALSETSLEIALERPAPYFLEQLTHFTAMPLHQASIEAFGSDFVRPAHLVTNGPFKLREFTPNERVVLVKNPLYYEAAQVALDQEIFISLEDRSAALLRFMAGEIQSYDDVPAEQLAFVRKMLPDSLKITPSLGIYYYAFDTRHPPFDDKRVRQALSMAIDRDFLAGRIWGGAMAPSMSFAPPDIPSYGAPAQAPWAAMTLFEREDQAKKLLAEAGYGEGGKKLEIEIRFNNSENHRATAVAVAAMWRALGVETRLVGTDGTSFYAFLREKTAFDVARSSWLADFPDAENFLFLAETANKGLDVPNFSSAAYDALMEEAGRERAPQKRSEILHRAEALLLEESPYAVLMSYRSSNLVSPKLRGWEPNALANHYGRYISIAPK
ncbi:peptide ABC transporter substrate-binding protein [Methylocapsa palsarum]|uniref:Peptide/nickel transport system substrate-binding protein/oligopeptide transport system substrate-binding protein n=1 Tax=Methylocapsa palsarum TaxID=1612308 RepID=A0A1I4BKZ4_9HYPH|nr:peptide ABC transporter substrate-binding protein [Methylocapsa palsarum]SFK68551.1 peptide/nickel transport system substrate-binding protein/oligopeptide transport system substrate-binding protein [Methylocapsa palsarum]